MEEVLRGREMDKVKGEFSPEQMGREVDLVQGDGNFWEVDP